MDTFGNRNLHLSKTDLDDTELSDRACSPAWPRTTEARVTESPTYADPEAIALETRARLHAARQQESLVFGERQRQADALRVAYANGRDEGFRDGYVKGFAWGKWCGLVAGVLLTVIASAFITWARQRWGF